MAKWGQVKCYRCDEPIYLSPKIIYGPHCKPCWEEILTDAIDENNARLRGEGYDGFFKPREKDEDYPRASAATPDEYGDVCM